VGGSGWFSRRKYIRAMASSQAPAPEPPSAPDSTADDQRGDQLRREVCTRCHVLPPPDVLPRDRWRDAIARMYLRRENQPEPPTPGQAGMLSLPEDFSTIARYYRRHAPEALPDPEPWPPVGARSPKFQRHLISPDQKVLSPAVSSVRFVDLQGDSRLELLVTDMRHGMIMRALPYLPAQPLETLGEVPNPAHVEVVDFDRDGIKDLLVADLGDFQPADHLKGSVVWMRGRENGTFASLAVGGLPRIADVQAADLDGDGDLDLTVAAFGWRKVGQTMVLFNDTTDYSHPSFHSVVVDARAGAIHVPPVDLDGDGRMDFVALVAQQHERVLAFYNNGKGAGFSMETLYAAPHPNWGSSGMQLVDLDADGDLDIILAHGDTLDDFIVKPYHGIQWLENRGNFQMAEHTLATLPGVHRAIGTDLDGDGDLDVLASAMIALQDHAVNHLASIVWLEQVSKGVFEKRTLKSGPPRHATIDAADFDLDGDIDFAVGMFTFGRIPSHSVEVWENLRNQKPKTAPTVSAPLEHRE
jgi:hypothetical protein